jgi:LPS sulfotransferase NodH
MVYGAPSQLKPSISNGLAQFLDSPPFRGTEENLRGMLPPGDEPAGTGELLTEGPNYIICYTPRSGSTHLISLLQHTGFLGKPSDFFNLEYVKLPLDAAQVYNVTGCRDIGNACKLGQVAGVEDYLRSLAVTRTLNGVFGMKADLYQASILMRRGLFRGPRVQWKYISITREDILMQGISYYRAIETGKWSSLSGSASGDCPFDEDNILRSMRTIVEIACGWEYAFGLFGIRPLRLTYEELEANPRATVARLADFVGVPHTAADLRIISDYGKQRAPEHERWADIIRARTAGFD